MFPLLKDLSSSITLVLPCTFFLQINFTASPITPIEYIPWQWSDQDILRKNRLFPKVTQTWGSYTMPINSHMPNNVCPVFSVCGLVVQCASSFTVAQNVVRISTSGVCICVLMSLGKENGLLTFIYFFPKQLWHLPVDQGKNQIMPDSLVPHEHRYQKQNQTKIQINNNDNKTPQACISWFCLFAIFRIWG